MLTESALSLRILDGDGLRVYLQDPRSPRKPSATPSATSGGDATAVAGELARAALPKRTGAASFWSGRVYTRYVRVSVVPSRSARLMRSGSG